MIAYFAQRIVRFAQYIYIDFYFLRKMMYNLRKDTIYCEIKGLICVKSCKEVAIEWDVPVRTVNHWCKSVKNKCVSGIVCQ